MVTFNWTLFIVISYQILYVWLISMDAYNTNRVWSYNVKNRSIYSSKWVRLINHEIFFHLIIFCFHFGIITWTLVQNPIPHQTSKYREINWKILVVGYIEKYLLYVWLSFSFDYFWYAQPSATVYSIHYVVNTGNLLNIKMKIPYQRLFG